MAKKYCHPGSFMTAQQRVAELQSRADQIDYQGDACDVLQFQQWCETSYDEWVELAKEIEWLKKIESRFNK